MIIAQAIAAALNLIGAILLAVDFWHRPQLDDAPTEPQAMLIQLCKALEQEPIDRDSVLRLREQAATQGTFDRAEAVRAGKKARHALMAGRWGIILISAGFLLQLSVLLLQPHA